MNNESLLEMMDESVELESKNFVSTRNACKLCAPLGASLAFRGVEGCVPLVHGSQGCSTYIRRYLISHFREPIDIASSNFSESSAIFGGKLNLKTALDNIIKQYKPLVIGLASTCLSETIGDDVSLYLDQYFKENAGKDLPEIIHAQTPSYSGSHMDGFRKALKAITQTIAEGGEKKYRLNLLTGMVSTEDLRYLKEIMGDFSIPYTLLPDYSDTMDGPAWETYQKMPEGGTTLADIRLMGQSEATIELGTGIKDEDSSGLYLENKFGVKQISMPLPMGINATDAFMKALSELSGGNIPEKYTKERGRLVDSYIDAHKIIFNKRAIVYGDQDFVAAATAFLFEIGVKPVLCASGDVTAKVKESLKASQPEGMEDITIAMDSDFMDILEKAETLKPDFLLGSSKGYFITRKLDIPLIRASFPIHDRIGSQRIATLGYRGAQALFDRIVNAVLEKTQAGSPVGYSYY